MSVHVQVCVCVCVIVRDKDYFFQENYSSCFTWSNIAYMGVDKKENEFSNIFSAACQILQKERVVRSMKFL